MTKTDELKRPYFTYSRESANIHFLRINDVSPMEETFEEFLQFSDRSAKELKGAMIVDFSQRGFLSMDERIKWSKVINANSEHIARNWTSLAFVNSSIVAMIALKGRLWIRPMPTKTKVFASLDEAVTWSYRIYLGGEN